MTIRFPRAAWAWEQARPRLGQTSLVIAVVAIGVGLAGGVLLAHRALQESLATSSNALSGEAQVIVTSSGGFGALDARFLDEVRATPGVAAAAPLVLATGFLEDKTPVRIVGVDMLDEGAVRVYRPAASPGTSAAGAPALDDPLVFLSQPDSILVPRATLERWGIDREGVVRIQTPAGLRRLTVRGVLDDDGVALAFAGHLVVMDLFAAQEALGLEGITRIDVRLADGAAAADVVVRLRSRLPTSVRVASASEFNAETLATVAAFQLYFDVIALVGLLLGAVITANRLATVYDARSPEIGILRSQGMSPREVLLRLLAEAGTITLLGVGLGLPAAIAMAQLMAGPLTQGMAAAARQEIVATWVPIRAVPLLVAAAAGLGSGVLAAMRPARRAAYRDVVDVLSRGRSRAPAVEALRRRRARRAASWLVSILALAGLASLSRASPAVAARLGPLSAVGVGVAGALLLRPGLRLATALLRPWFGSATTIGIDDQSVAPGRAVGAAAVLMFGGGTVVLVVSLGGSFEDHIIAQTVSPRRGDLVVDSSANVLSKGEGEPRLRDDVVEKLRGIRGVKVAAAGVAASIDDPPTGIWAVDGEWLLHPELGDFLVEGDDAANALARVARGEALLANFPAGRPGDIGDVVTLATPSGSLRLPIAARMKSVVLSPAGNVVFSRSLYREHWRERTVHHVHLLVDDGASVTDVARRIRDELGPTYGLRVQTPAEMETWYRATIRQALVVADAIAALALLVVLLGTADALGANVHERTREIGAMRALGCPPARARQMVLVQALGIGVTGAGLALLVGLGWSLAYVDGVVPATLGWNLRLHVPVGLAVGASVGGTAACLGGALLPAVRAGRLPIVEALRHE